MNEPKEFSLDTSYESVVLTLNGAKEVFEIREMSAEQHELYSEKMMTRFEKTDEKDEKGNAKMRMVKFHGMYADLLSRCLFQSNGVLVQATTIANWPKDTVKALYELAQKVNKIGEETTPKND